MLIVMGPGGLYALIGVVDSEAIGGVSGRQGRNVNAGRVATLADQRPGAGVPVLGSFKVLPRPGDGGAAIGFPPEPEPLPMIIDLDELTEVPSRRKSLDQCGDLLMRPDPGHP
jgi:hypothetical protein